MLVKFINCKLTMKNKEKINPKRARERAKLKNTLFKLGVHLPIIQKRQIIQYTAHINIMYKFHTYKSIMVGPATTILMF